MNFTENSNESKAYNSEIHLKKSEVEKEIRRSGLEEFDVDIDLLTKEALDVLNISQEKEFKYVHRDSLSKWIEKKIKLEKLNYNWLVKIKNENNEEGKTLGKAKFPDKIPKTDDGWFYSWFSKEKTEDEEKEKKRKRKLSNIVWNEQNTFFYPRRKKKEDYYEVMKNLDNVIISEIRKGNIHQEYYDDLSDEYIYNILQYHSENVDSDGNSNAIKRTLEHIIKESKDFIIRKKNTNDLMKKGKGERGQIMEMSEVWFPEKISFGPEYNNHPLYNNQELTKLMIDDFKKKYGGILKSNKVPKTDKNGNEMACASDCKCSLFPCIRPKCQHILNSNKIPPTIEEKWTYCKSPSENKKTVGGAKKKKSKKKFKKRNYKKLKKRKTKKKMKFRKKTKKKRKSKRKK